MANIVDLIGDFRNTVRVNDNISYPYMLYQFFMFASTVLGPATVIMMIAGSYNAVLGVSLWQSYLMSLGPIIFFTTICMTCRSDTQISVAAMLSALYSIIMLVVIVGTIINGIFDTWTSPNVVFMTGLISFFFFSAVLHPQEFGCVVFGAIYFLCIPSGYLLLIIYSICNLNNVSWGTREIPKKKTKEELLQEKLEEEERARKKANKGLLSWLGIGNLLNDLKDFYTTMLGSRVSRSEDTLESILVDIRTSLETLPKKIANPNDVSIAGAECQSNERVPNVALQIAEHEAEQVLSPAPLSPTLTVYRSIAERPLPKRPVREDAWMYDALVVKGSVGYVDDKEMAFWRQLIHTYLLPLPHDKKRIEKTALDLKSLRNNVVFGFLMANFLWIVISFQLQMSKSILQGYLTIPIPRADDPTQFEHFEPLGFVFLLFFATILLLQFIAMIMHRWSTLLQLLSITEIRWPWRKKYDFEDDIKGAIDFSRKLQKIRGIDEEPEVDYDDDDDEDIYESANVMDKQGNNKTKSEPSHPLPDYEAGGQDNTAAASYAHGSHQPPQRFRYDKNQRYDRKKHRRNNLIDDSMSAVSRRRHRNISGPGQRMASGDTLQRAFRRRFNLLANEVWQDGGQVPNFFDPTRPVDDHGVRADRPEQRHHRQRHGRHAHHEMYRTMRQKYDDSYRNLRYPRHYEDPYYRRR